MNRRWLVSEILIKAMTECKCENDEMVTKEECEKHENSAWRDGALNTTTISFITAVCYELGSKLAEVDSRLDRLLERLR